MKTRGKILGFFLLLGGSVFGLSKLTKLAKTANTGKQMSVNITGVDPPKIKSGALQLSVNVTFDNPTNNVINMKKPYLTAFYNGKEVGNSIPSQEYTPIKANDRTTIKGINIQIPFLKLGGIVVQLIMGKVPKMAFDIKVITYVNGFRYTDNQHFEL